MRSWWKRHAHTVAIASMLLGVTAYAMAEELTLSTLYPSPRGVYRTLRVGSATVSAPGGQLHVVSVDPVPPFRIEGAAGQPWVTVDTAGQLGLGTLTPTNMLHVTQTVRIEGGGPDTGKVLSSVDASGSAIWDDPKYAP